MDAGESLDGRALRLLDGAMDQPREGRAAWIAAYAEDDAARDRALALLQAEPGAGWAFQTGAAAHYADDAPMPERIGAYRVTGLIGQGGMGAVYRGERAKGDFDHIVAIKLIRPGALSDALIERFQRERQTLAGLSHPHIARLFDGGETETGQPYIVMEHVEGLPLSEWIAAAKPPPDARLKLFLDICSAVSFAHQNLIIHRDITPSNVLVTHDGAAKLIDFGIARPNEPEAAAPSQLSNSLAGLSLTPGFAAPERVAGLAATTLSDVYSLGRLLESMVGKDQDGDLAAIIAMASAADSADRYPTVDALIQDIDNYRAGRVVEARHGGKRYAIGKFVGRYRGLVAAASIALVVLVAALTMTLIANQHAQAARADAEQRFEQTRSLAKVMMFDVYDAVSAVPGSTEARFLLARTAQRYLDSLAADQDAPADIRLDVGEGYFRLARVVGFTGGGSLGRREDGARLFDRAHHVLAGLHAEQPGRADVRTALGHLLSVRSGERLYGDGDSAIARQEARQSRALLEGLPRLDARAAGALAGTYLYEGDSWGWDNDIPAAGRVYEQGIHLVAAMPEALRSSEAVRMALSGLLRQSGAVYRHTGQPDRAIVRLQEAVALNRQLVSASGGSPAADRKLLTSLWALADIYFVTGRLDPALKAITEAQAIARANARAGGGDSGARESIALTGLVLAQVESARGMHPRAVAAATEAIAIRRELVDKGGDNKGARLTLAVGLKDAAPVFRAAKDTVRACASLAEAAAIMDVYARAETLSDYDRQNNLEPVRTALEACSA